MFHLLFSLSLFFFLPKNITHRFALNLWWVVLYHLPELSPKWQQNGLYFFFSIFFQELRLSQNWNPPPISFGKRMIRLMKLLFVSLSLCIINGVCVCFFFPPIPFFARPFAPSSSYSAPFFPELLRWQHLAFSYFSPRNVRRK